MQFTAYEIWPKNQRCGRFRELIQRYFTNIYLSHIRTNPNKTPAPKNFWPYSYQFYLCNPIKTFQATAFDVNNSPRIEIDYYLAPESDREMLTSESMPSKLLNQIEVSKLLNNRDFVAKYKMNGIESKQDFCRIIDAIDESDRSILDLRATDDDASPIGSQTRH